MRTGYPTASAESGQKGLLGRAQKAAAATGCPIDFQQAPQLELLPQSRAYQSEQPREAVAPLTEKSAKAQQQIDEECDPHLPAHGSGVVTVKVGQLQQASAVSDVLLFANLPAKEQAELQKAKL